MEGGGGQFEAERDGIQLKFQGDPLAAMGWVDGNCGAWRKQASGQGTTRQDRAVPMGLGQQTQMSKWGRGRTL